MSRQNGNKTPRKLLEISTPPLVKADELALFTELKSGCPEGRAKEIKEKITAANIPLVLNLARRFCHDQADYDELIGDGLARLAVCLVDFDPSRDVRFSTYLTRAVVFSFMRMQQLANRAATKERGFVTNQDDRQVEPNEASVEPESDELRDLRAVLEVNAAGLDDEEVQVIRLSFTVEQLTVHEISQRLHMSRGRVSKLRMTALAKLKEVLK